MHSYISQCCKLVLKLSKPAVSAQGLVLYWHVRYFDVHVACCSPLNPMEQERVRKPELFVQSLEVSPPNFWLLLVKASTYCTGKRKIKREGRKRALWLCYIMGVESITTTKKGGGSKDKGVKYLQRQQKEWPSLLFLFYIVVQKGQTKCHAASTCKKWIKGS